MLEKEVLARQLVVAFHQKNMARIGILETIMATVEKRMGISGVRSKKK